MSGKHGDGCLGDGCPLQVEIFLHLRDDTEVSHYLVHVLGLVMDKGQDQDRVQGSDWLRQETQMSQLQLMSSKNVGSEKAMAPYSSTLAWKIPWTEEPLRLRSMGSLGVRHD